MTPTTPRPAKRKGRPKGFNQAGQTTIQSLDRALDVLDTLAAAGGITLTELSTRLGQSPATMYRVLGTLQARQVVEIDAPTQGWHIGPAAFRLGSAFLRRSGVVEKSRPVMRELMQATGETANLGIARDGEVMFISQVETQASIRAFFPPGTLTPMHSSGIGKALLGCLDAPALDKFLRTHRLERFTDRTFTDPAGLRAELAATAARGWSFDNEEKTPGMRCVAAPVFNAHGEAVAGISVSGPTGRMPDDRIEAIAALVMEAAATVSGGLGAPPGA